MLLCIDRQRHNLFFEDTVVIVIFPCSEVLPAYAHFLQRAPLAAGWIIIIKPSTYHTPFNESVQPQDGCIGRLIVKVRILNSVSSISQAQSSGVSAPFPNCLSHRQEITSALRHLLPIQHQMTVRSHTQRPVLFGEEGDVVVDAEGKVVRDEVLAGGTNVEWVEVGEGTSESFERVFRDVGGLGEGPRREDVVPDFVGHLFDSNTQRSRSLAFDVGYDWKSLVKDYMATRIGSNEPCKRLATV